MLNNPQREYQMQTCTIYQVDVFKAQYTMSNILLMRLHLKTVTFQHEYNITSNEIRDPQ